VIEQKQLEEVKRVQANALLEQGIKTTVLLALFLGIPSFIACTYYIFWADESDIWILFVPIVFVFLAYVLLTLSSLPLFKGSAHSLYETNKSIEECWEEMKTLNRYTNIMFRHATIFDTKSDKQSLEMTFRPLLSRKMTFRNSMSEEKFPESMTVDTYLNTKPMDQNRIKMKRVDDKTTVEIDTTYIRRIPLVSYSLLKLLNPQVMAALGYSQKEYRTKISFR
jgi:hypothetical protein